MREGALGVGKPDAIRSPRLRNVKRSRNETGRGMRTEHRRKVVCWCESVDAGDEIEYPVSGLLVRWRLFLPGLPVLPSKDGISPTSL